MSNVGIEACTVCPANSDSTTGGKNLTGCVCNVVSFKCYALIIWPHRVWNTGSGRCRFLTNGKESDKCDLAPPALAQEQWHTLGGAQQSVTRAARLLWDKGIRDVRTFMRESLRSALRPSLPQQLLFLEEHIGTPQDTTFGRTEGDRRGTQEMKVWAPRLKKVRDKDRTTLQNNFGPHGLAGSSHDRHTRDSATIHKVGS